MESYDLGNLVRVSGSFTTVTGAPADPTTITLRVKDPTGTIAVYTGGAMVRDGIGAYHYDLVPAKSGTWSYRWEGTGAVTAAGDSSFAVTPSAIVAG